VLPSKGKHLNISAGTVFDHVNSLAMKLPTLSKRFWIICSTLLVIGTVFAYYLLVYVEGREQKLRQDKYRALERLGENMIQTRENYHKAIELSWLRTRAIIDTLQHQFYGNRNSLERARATDRHKSDLLDSTRKRIDQLIKKDSIRERLIDLRENIEDSASDSTAAFWKQYRDILRDKVTADVQRDLPKVRYDGSFNKM